MIYIKFFNTPVSNIKGVGQTTELLLKKLNVDTLGSLISLLPHRYENWENIRRACDSIDEINVIKVQVIKECSFFESRSGIKIYKVKCIDVNCYKNTIIITFFHSNFVASSMEEGQQYLAMGKVTKGYSSDFEIVCPKIKLVTSELINFEPVYPQVKGLSSLKMRKIMSEAFKLLPETICDTIPEKFLKKYGLASLDFALRNIHFPSSKENLIKSLRRIGFEELVCWISSLRRVKNTKDCNFIIEDFSSEFEKLLEFELTNSQKKNIEICVKDMKSGKSMMRLLQGDVGSGKTIVAMSLAFNVIKSGFQAVLMVPTEVLAVQHYNNFSKIIREENVCFLSGSTRKREKERIISRFRVGIPGILIGTHSLISDDVEFRSLALVIIDEQHKFGVNQREKLIEKGNNPHKLVMSATPIPRSLAMIVYGDMDLCVIDELPKGRKKVRTVVLESKERTKAFNFIKCQILDGHQAYIVCAKIGDFEDIESEEINVAGYRNNIIRGFFDEFKIGVLHGRMSPLEKDDIIRDFSNKKLDILISTTVIEVGIDIPNATVILIENAERFGLASLHQMRGRVGRGTDESFCILICGSNSESAYQRLQIMSNVSDGFLLANEDLKMRGPGDMLGIKQHGQLSERLIASLKNPKMVSQAIELLDFMNSNPRQKNNDFFVVSGSKIC